MTKRQNEGYVISSYAGDEVEMTDLRYSDSHSRICGVEQPVVAWYA